MCHCCGAILCASAEGYDLGFGPCTLLFVRDDTGGDAVYDAFISYNQASDRPLAIAVQTGLQQFAKPWYRRRALRVFRDESSLSAMPGLWPTIERALAASNYFVLIASPESSQSRWVRPGSQLLAPPRASRPAPARTQRRATDVGAAGF